MTDSNDVVVRDFRRDDLEAVLALRAAVFPGLDLPRERRRWTWEFDENPARDPAVPDSWILEHEGFDRGWYAAPVGWTDLDGNGELRVALRSALVDESQVQLFSGAGIVADSVAEDELAETGVKLRALLDVMESAQ